MENPVMMLLDNLKKAAFNGDFAVNQYEGEKQSEKQSC
jgi:hypothetical protein